MIMMRKMGSIGIDLKVDHNKEHVYTELGNVRGVTNFRTINYSLLADIVYFLPEEQEEIVEKIGKIEGVSDVKQYF
jgi:hypothetical protein